MRRASARRTALFASGRGEDHDRASPPISGTKAPTCLARFVQRGAQARRSPCRMPTPKPCSFTSMKLPAPSPGARGAHAVLLLDRAVWHTTGDLVVPKNMTLIFLPSRAPELNPVENIWQSLRGNWLSNRIFDSYEAIIDAACEAWQNLVAEPETIASIGMRDLAHIGQG